MALDASPQVQISPKDLLLACAKDSDLFARHWFPKTCRQKSPEIHKQIWATFDDPSIRLLNIEAARDFAKTSLARICTAKRIAYATSRTILYVGASDPHAQRSVMWLRNRIAVIDPASGKLVPTKFARFYGLSPGAKWNENELEINHGLSKTPIWVLGVGITGNIRGINFDDYRPDFIFCDDILTDENTATKEQRAKVFDLVFGALRQSLAPRVDEPNAKMVLAHTIHDEDDVVARAKRSKEFYTISAPCWTQSTIDLPIEEQVSAWPERWPTLDLRAEKRAAIEENRYSIFAREKECRLITQENAAFMKEWARFYIGPSPEGMFSVLAIDPVPPPSERQIASNLATKDYECQMVVGRWRDEYHVLHYELHRGHDPSWSTNTALQLARDFKIAKIIVEVIAYQRVLKWVLKKAMEATRRFYVIDEAWKNSRLASRAKYTRIVSTIAGPLSHGKVLIRADMDELRKQIEMYPRVEHDDCLDALSIAMWGLVNPYMENEANPGGIESNIEDLEIEWACP